MVYLQNSTEKNLEKNKKRGSFPFSLAKILLVAIGFVKIVDFCMEITDFYLPFLAFSIMFFNKVLEQKLFYSTKSIFGQNFATNSCYTLYIIEQDL